MLRRHSIATIIIAACAVFSFGFVPAYADESAEETVPKTGSILEISPVTKRVALNASDTHDSTIDVKNTGTETVKFRVYATPFSMSDDGETQDFEKETTYTQIARWITIKTDSGSYDTEASFTLAPQESKTVDYKISVPDDVPGGGQYAVLFVESIPSTQSSDAIQTVSRAGMTIYATMPGEPKRSVHVENIDVNSFVLDGNIGVQARVKNDGNIDFQTSTEINIYSIFGKQLYNNTVLAAILPENSKTIYAGWKDSPSFGIFRLEYSIYTLDILANGSQIILVMTPLILAFAIVLFSATIIAIVYLVKRRSANKKGSAPTISIG